MVSQLKLISSLCWLYAWVNHACQDYEKMVVLLMDEMYVKEDIVYNKHTGQLISFFLKFSLAAFIGQLLGFVDMGKINNHLLLFEKQLASNSDIDSPPLAKTMIVFMVKSLFSSFRYLPMSSFRVLAYLATCYTNHFGRQFLD